MICSLRKINKIDKTLCKLTKRPVLRPAFLKAEVRRVDPREMGGDTSLEEWRER
jgi:hypothetical protein